MLEIVDYYDKPILLQHYNQAKNLPHREVVLLLQNKQGKLLLWPQSKQTSPLEFLSGCVFAGQAKEEAARILLEKKLSSLAISVSKEYLKQLLENTVSMVGAKLFDKNTDIYSQQLSTAPSQRQRPRCKNFPPKTHDQLQKELHYTTFFIYTIAPKEQIFSHKSLLWLDLDELQGFAEHFADMLYPKTLALIKHGHIKKIMQR